MYIHTQEYLATTALRLLTKLDKWGRCVSGAGESAVTNYVKRVEHDSLVEERDFRDIYQRLKVFCVCVCVCVCVCIEKWTVFKLFPK